MNTAERNPTRRLAAAALLGLCMAPALIAGETQGTVSVLITVPVVARVEVLSQQPALQITPADLERGYVDVTEPTLLRVISNARDGYALEVLPMSPLVHSIDVRGVTGDARLGPEGGTIVQRWDRPRSEALSLTFRLGLSAGIQPGRYRWPLHFAAQPL